MLISHQKLGFVFVTDIGAETDSDGSVGNILADSSSDEYVPDDTDSDCAPAEDETYREKTKKTARANVMEAEGPITVMDVNGVEEGVEEQIEMGLMEDNKTMENQMYHASSSIQTEDECELPLVHAKKKMFSPKLKVTRKRQRKPDTWKKHKSANCRARGEAYTNYKGEVKPAKTVVSGSLCPNNCRLQCSTKFTIEQREAIFSTFHQLDVNAKNALLFKSIKKRPVKRKRNGAVKHKTASYQYSATSNGNETLVCKRAFVALYNISMKKVDLIQESLKSGLPAPPPDKRGRHNTRPNKTPKHVVEYIIQHISSFPAEESHYSRNCNIHKKYLSAILSIPLMHKIYIEKCDAEQVADEFKVKICTYRHIFNNEFNLSFGHPKSDTCKTCDSGAGSEEHTENYKAAFEAQKADRELARNSRGTVYITMDLQQTMPLPRISTSAAFYLRQMWFYNLGIHIIAKDVDKTVFCTWTEDQAGRGSSEIFSSLLRIIEVEVSLKDKDHLIIWTDSCSGQNKNFLMICLYQYIVQKGTFLIIDHKFPEVGHSYLDSDRDFGRIEKRLRKYQTICTPEEYRKVIASSSRKNLVIDMEPHFRVTEDLPNKMKIFNRKRDLSNEKVRFRDGIKWLRVERYGSYLFKECYDYYVPFKEVNILRDPKSKSPLPKDVSIPRLCKKTGSLSKEKIENLKQQLCFVPQEHRWFYERVLSCEETYDCS